METRILDEQGRHSRQINGVKVVSSTNQNYRWLAPFRSKACLLCAPEADFAATIAAETGRNHAAVIGQ
jgi:hypothetical protein